MTASTVNATETFTVRGTSWTIYQDHATGFWSVADNLLKQSEDFGTSWTNEGTTDSLNQTTDPIGTTTADEITANAGSSRKIIFQGAGVFTDIPIRFSCNLKAGTTAAAYLNVQTGANAFSAVFDLTAGTVGDTAVGNTSGTVISASIEDAGSSWFLCTIVGSESATTTQNVVVGIAETATGNSLDGNGDISFNAAGTETIFVWGAQFSQQASANLTYLKTTTAIIAQFPSGSEELLGQFTSRDKIKREIERFGR